MTQGDRLRLLAKAAGYEHLSEFAEAAGIKPGTAQQQANRNSIPRSAAKKYISRALATGADVNWLLDGVGAGPTQAEQSPNDRIQPAAGSETEHQSVAALPPPNAEITSAAPPLPLRQDMDKDVPVYGTVVGGDLGNHADFELNGQIVDYVRRPPRFRGRADLFAAYTQGESMLYWREPGQLIYFEKARPPRVMDYVLVELKPHNGDDVRPALIKRLLAVTPTKVRLRQYNPQKDFEIDRSKVLQIVRVVDWDELMGV